MAPIVRCKGLPIRTPSVGEGASFDRDSMYSLTFWNFEYLGHGRISSLPISCDYKLKLEYIVHK